MKAPESKGVISYFLWIALFHRNTSNKSRGIDWQRLQSWKVINFTINSQLMDFQFQKVLKCAYPILSLRMGSDPENAADSKLSLETGKKDENHAFH